MRQLNSNNTDHLEFDLDFYRKSNYDLQNLDDSGLLEHWLKFGKSEGRFGNPVEFEKSWSKLDINSEFSSQAYLFLNPDLPYKSDLQAKIHYIKTGIHELREFNFGNLITSPELLDLLAKLRIENNLVKGEMLSIDQLTELKTSGSALCNEVEQWNDQNPKSVILNIYDMYLEATPSPFHLNLVLITAYHLDGNSNEAKSFLDAILRIEILKIYRNSLKESTANANKVLQLMGSTVQHNFDQMLSKFNENDNFLDTKICKLQDIKSRLCSRINAFFSKRIKSKPIITIITSVYNGDNYLEFFLKNITSIKYFYKSELVFIDAASPGNELQIISKFQKDFPNIKYFHVNERIGIYDAWNLGIEKASGSLITTANLDDLRLRKYLSKSYKILKNNDDIDIVFGNFYYALKPNFPVWKSKRIGLSTNLPLMTTHNLLEFNSPHCAPMWRKDIHKDVGLFDTNFKSAGDWEFWLRCAFLNKNFGQFKNALSVYFLNPEGISTNINTLDAQEQEPIRNLYRKFILDDERILSRLIQ